MRKQNPLISNINNDAPNSRGIRFYNKRYVIHKNIRLINNKIPPSTKVDIIWGLIVIPFYKNLFAVKMPGVSYDIICCFCIISFIDTEIPKMKNYFDMSACSHYHIPPIIFVTILEVTK